MIKTASQYHNHSSYERGKLGGHYLDWSNQPVVYKEYPGIEPVQLPLDVPELEENLSSILIKNITNKITPPFGIEDLSHLLRLTYTLTAKARHSNEDFYYRSAASAGALYPTEIYVATHGIDGLEDGLYHFGIRQHTLSRLRAGSFSDHVSNLLIPPSKKKHELTFFFTAIFFRSAWKYRDRAYRYHLLDTGHVIENLYLAIKAFGLPFNLSYDFNDNDVNRLLGLDTIKEVTLAIISIPGTEFTIDSDLMDIPELSGDIRDVSKVSKNEIEYTAIEEIHQASAEVVSKPENYESEILSSLGIAADLWEEWDITDNDIFRTTYTECLFKRRSSRNFIQEPIEKEYLFDMLDLLCGNTDIETKNKSIHRDGLVAGFVANNVKGINPGLYMIDMDTKRFGLVTEGVFGDIAAHICLDQEWLRNASIHFLFLCNIDALEGSLGARGYRYAMLTAGRFGERIYMASTAMGLGCCGIGAFYDYEASELLGLDTNSKLLYLVAAGKVKR